MKSNFVMVQGSSPQIYIQQSSKRLGISCGGEPLRKILILLSIILLLFSGCVQDGRQKSSAPEYKIVGGGGPYKEAILSIQPQALDREIIRYGKGGMTFDIGLTPDQSRAYVANQVDGNITIISLDENRILDRFPAEKGVREIGRAHV